MEPQESSTPNLTTCRYDLHYEIDPGRGVFRSTQDITLTNASGKSTDQIAFLLHPDLLIDRIALRDAQGRPLPVKGWRADGTQEIFVNKLQRIKVEMDGDIVPGQQLGLHLKYHASPERFEASPAAADHILDLTLSDASCYAVGPHSGHYAVFDGKIAAPFRIAIAHAGEEIDPAHLGHALVRDHDLRGLAVEDLQRFGGARCREDAHFVCAQEALQCLQDVDFVIDE